MPKTKAERRKYRQEKKLKNAIQLEQDKICVADFCGLSHKSDALQIIAAYAIKQGVTLRGDLHPHVQIKYFAKLIRMDNKYSSYKDNTKISWYNPLYGALINVKLQ